MLALGLAACGPGFPYALHTAVNQRDGVLPADAHLGLQHWAALSAAALAALFTALLASMRREAFVIPGLTAAAAVLAWAATCLAYPKGRRCAQLDVGMARDFVGGRVYARDAQRSATC